MKRNRHIITTADSIPDGESKVIMTVDERDADNWGILVKQSATVLALEAIEPGVRDYVSVNNEIVDISTAKTTDIATDNTLSVTGEDSGVLPQPGYEYYVYLSNSKTTYAPNSIRLSTNPPQDGYLAGVENWRLVGTVTIDDLGNIVNRNLVNTAFLNRSFNNIIVIWGQEFFVKQGASLSYSAIENQIYQHRAYHEPPAVGDEREQYVFLSKGAWRFECLYMADYDCGIMSLRIDDIELTSIDTYAASPIFNLKYSQDYDAIESRIYKVSIVTTGKNASSSDYYTEVTKVSFIKIDEVGGSL